MRIALTTLSSAVLFALAAPAMANNGNGNGPAVKPGHERVIVWLTPGRAAEGRAAARAIGAVEVLDIDAETKAMIVPTHALEGLSHNPNISFIEPDYVRNLYATGDTASTGTPYALGQTVPYGIKSVQADQMPAGDSLTANRKVCIIDSGYDNSHEDLLGNAVTGEYDSGTGWWYTDENHHGTHVAGTIAGINNAGVGVVGVNPNKKLKLHIVKVFSAAGWAYSSSLVTATNKCKAAGANVISMSLGGGGKSKTEERAFASLATGGILSIAAAGNDGNAVMSYPASYPTVMSVAAADVDGKWASFSQYTSAVDISGPGVAVLSTVPSHTVSVPAVSVGGTAYAAGSMDGSPTNNVTAPLADFGLGGSVVAGSMTGKVCLIQRGSFEFGVKVKNCQSSGGVGAIVYNNAAGGFSGTLGTTTGITISSVTASDVDGAAMKTKLGQSAAITFGQSAPIKYEEYNGTSMATPHVSAVAALVWSYHTNCTGNQIKASLEKSAKDLTGSGTSDTGTAVTYGVGRDNATGYGMVQALAAHNRINSLGCGN